VCGGGGTRVLPSHRCRWHACLLTALTPLAGPGCRRRSGGGRRPRGACSSSWTPRPWPATSCCPATNKYGALPRRQEGLSLRCGAAALMRWMQAAWQAASRAALAARAGHAPLGWPAWRRRPPAAPLHDCCSPTGEPRPRVPLPTRRPLCSSPLSRAEDLPEREQLQRGPDPQAFELARCAAWVWDHLVGERRRDCRALTLLEDGVQEVGGRRGGTFSHGVCGWVHMCTACWGWGSASCTATRWLCWAQPWARAAGAGQAAWERGGRGAASSPLVPAAAPAHGSPCTPAPHAGARPAPRLVWPSGVVAARPAWRAGRDRQPPRAVRGAGGGGGVRAAARVAAQRGGAAGAAGSHPEGAAPGVRTARGGERGAGRAAAHRRSEAGRPRRAAGAARGPPSCRPSTCP
jgi:hypothetical protein